MYTSKPTTNATSKTKRGLPRSRATPTNVQRLIARSTVEQSLKHPQHKHTWNECFENPKGPNYNPKANSTAGKAPSKKSTDSGDAKVHDEMSMSTSSSLFSNN
eukprot:scaffold5391_cov175-Alexandrium_tamarense.AAC.18